AGASLFVFGSGLAIVPFLYGGVVRQFHWLTERQFIDAVAVSMITPGPVVITVAFIGYLVAGLAGAILAAIGVFLPVYLITVLVAPHFHRVAKNRQVKAFVDGVTAAATGAIAGAAVILGRRALMDGPTILIALGPVTLDGRVDEPFWAAADSIDDFRQREPLEGSPATERTVVKVAHDAGALYIVVRCYDSDMRGVRASQLRRDADLSSDDNVRLLI